MSIEITCVQCGTSHQINERLAGRRVRCPECDTAIHVPELAEPSVDSAAEVEVVVEPEAVPATVVEAMPAEAVVAEPAETQAISAAPVAAVAVASQEETPPAEPPSPLEDDPDMSMPPRKGRDEEELDMTPMVDVTFLLLIFFMVTASFSLQKSVEMPRQKTDAPSTSAVEEEPEELDQVELQIDEFGGFLVLTPDWEEETPGKQRLISKLKEARGDGGEAKLVIKVHEEARLQSLVDGMDAGTIAGYNELQVTQVDEFD